MRPEDATLSNPHARRAAAHFEPLRWIGAYKLLKAAMALVGGLLVLRIEHRNLPVQVLRWMHYLHIDPHSPIGTYILHHTLEIKPSQFTWAATSLFVYTAITAVEGLGLVFRRAWAEWLTVVTTSALIPYEAWRAWHRPDWVHALIIVLNVLVVIYLVWRIRRDQRARAHRAAGGQGIP